MGVGNVLGAGREHVEDEPAAGRQPLGDGAQDGAPVDVRLHVQQRAERDHDQRKRPLDRRVAHVSLPQVDAHPGQRRALARDLEHPLRQVDADDLNARRSHRDGDPRRADAELQHRPARANGLVDVKRDVLDDAARPGVVEPRDVVVDGHAGMLLPMQAMHATMFTRPRWSGRGVR